MIKILFIGSNTKICAPNSTYLIENLPDEILEKHGYKRYCIGPGHYIPPSISDLYNWMGGKPDVIFEAGAWYYYAQVERDWLKITYRITDDEIGRLWGIENELIVKNVAAQHYEDYWRGGALRELDQHVISAMYSGRRKTEIEHAHSGKTLHYIPFSVDIDLINADIDKPVAYEAYAPGSISTEWLYPYRLEAIRIIEDKQLSTPRFSRVWKERPKGKGYFGVLNQSEILVIDGGIFKVPFKKIFEGLASTAMCIFDTDIETLVSHGVKDGIHYRGCSIDEISKTLDHYLTHEEETKKIAMAGRDYFLRELNPEKMAIRYLFPVIHELMGYS